MGTYGVMYPFGRLMPIIGAVFVRNFGALWRNVPRRSIFSNYWALFGAILPPVAKITCQQGLCGIFWAIY